MMKSIIYSVLMFSLLLPSMAHAAPPAPWLAVAEGPISMSMSECISAARATFNAQGFARVSTVGSSVMAAYQGGQDYQFKAVIKCLPAASTAVAVVVTTVSGAGTDRANSLISGLSQHAFGGDDDAGFAEDEEMVPADDFMEDDAYMDDDFVDDYVDDY